MGRWIDYNPSPKTISNASTAPAVFQANDIPGSARGVGNLVGISLAFEYVTASGAPPNTARIARVKAKASGNLIMDISGTQLRAFYGRFAPANVIPAGTGQLISLWFNAFDMDDDDQADQCGFPYGTVPTVEVTFDGTQSAGSMTAAYIFSDVEAHKYATLIAQPMGIAASQNSMGYPLNEAGQIRGVGLTSTGLGRARLLLGGRQWINAPGPGAATATTNTMGDLARETQQIELDQTLVTDTFFRLPNVQAPQGSRIELTTAAGSGGSSNWAGIANEIAIWALHDQAA
jgi:hypothetical protein